MAPIKLRNECSRVTCPSSQCTAPPSARLGGLLDMTLGLQLGLISNATAHYYLLWQACLNCTPPTTCTPTQHSQESLLYFIFLHKHSPGLMQYIFSFIYILSSPFASHPPPTSTPKGKGIFLFGALLCTQGLTLYLARSSCSINTCQMPGKRWLHLTLSLALSVFLSFSTMVNHCLCNMKQQNVYSVCLLIFVLC